MTTPATDLRLALGLADTADRITAGAYGRRDLVVETKPDLTPVTEADRATERRLRQQLARQRPEDAVVGEEYGTEGASARRWIVDPIDGTKNFVRGIPVWATLIALEVDGVITVGVVSAPALSRRWWAARGLGAWASTVGGPVARLAVSGIGRLADAQVSYGGLDVWDDYGGAGMVAGLGRRCWRARAFGDFWSHMLVAEGACEVGIDPVASLWDLAALQVIVEEAGGRFTDRFGASRSDGGSGISSNGHVHAEVLDVLNGA